MLYYILIKIHNVHMYTTLVPGVRDDIIELDDNTAQSMEYRLWYIAIEFLEGLLFGFFF